MKILVAVVFILSAPSLLDRGLAQAAGEIFSLAISTSQDVVTAGSDVKLLVKLTNTAPYTIALNNSDQYCAYIVEVRDSSGQSAPETETKRTLNCSEHPVAGKVIILKLKPGEHHEDLIFANELFDMTRPDQYTLRVARQVPKQLGQGRVESNTISITVTE